MNIVYKKKSNFVLTFTEKLALFGLIILPWNNFLSVGGSSVGPFDFFVLLFTTLSLPNIAMSLKWWYREKPLVYSLLTLGILSTLLFLPIQDEVMIDLKNGILPLMYAYFFMPLFIRTYFTKRIFPLVNKIYIFYLLLMVIFLFLYFKFGIPVATVSGNNRYNTILSGQTFIVVMSLSWVSYQFISKKCAFSLYFIFAFLSFIVVLYAQQRSLFVGVVAIFLLTAMRVNLMRTLFVVGGIGVALMLYINFFEGSLLNSRTLNTENLLSDPGRVLIVSAFFDSLLENPLRIFTGWGYSGWGYGIAYQPPHNLFLDFLEKFGLIAAVGASLFVFQPVKNVFCRSEYAWYYVFFLAGTLPYYMLHTYPAVREFSFPIILVTFYAILHVKGRESSVNETGKKKRDE